MSKKKDEITIHSGVADGKQYNIMHYNFKAIVTDREIISDTGKVMAEIVKQHAETSFEKYRIAQDRLFERNFERFLELAGAEVETDE